MTKAASDSEEGKSVTVHPCPSANYTLCSVAKQESLAFNDGKANEMRSAK